MSLGLRSGKLSAYLQGGLFLLILGLVVRQFALHWHTVPPITTVDMRWLFAALALGLAAQTVIPLILQQLLAAHGVVTSYRRAFGLYFVPSQGKYIPGKIWAATWAVSAYRREGASLAAALSCMLLLTAINLISAVLIALLTASTLTPDQEWLTLAGLLLISLHPRAFYTLLNRALNWFGKPPLPHTISAGALLRLVLLNGGYWLVLGFGLLCLNQAIMPSSGMSLGLICAQALAQVSGLLAFFAPAGLGVREGVLASLLAPSLGLGPAMLLAAVQRLWLLAVEVPCALLGWALLRSSPGPAPKNPLEPIPAEPNASCSGPVQTPA